MNSLMISCWIKHLRVWFRFALLRNPPELAFEVYYRNIEP